MCNVRANVKNVNSFDIYNVVSMCLDLDLPVSLLKDLLPHLNIYYLDRIETAAATKGTYE